MYNVDFESLKLPEFDNFVDLGNILSLWQAAILDPNVVHYHIQGPRWSGKTHLLEATLHATHDWPRAALCLHAEDFTVDKLLERDYADWFYFDNIDQLNSAQQSIFIAWLNQCIAHQGKIFTSSSMDTSVFYNDLRSRIQSSFTVTLHHPQCDDDWCRMLTMFFLRYHIHVSPRIMLCILDVTERIADSIFPLVCELAHQSRPLTFQRVHATHRMLQGVQHA